MEVLKYMAPAASFPRYEYSKRHVSRVVDDFHILMKDLELDFSELSVPEYSDVEIFVTKSNNFVDETYIGLRNPNKVKFKGNHTFDNVDDILKSNMQEADIVHPKIIVVSASKVSDMEPFVPFHLNAVIVAEDASIKACMEENYREENTISVTTKENLGMTICLLLERVVFRNLREFVYVLKELMEVAMFEHVRRIVLTEDITYLLKSFLENDDCFMGWLKETEGYEKKSANHKNTKNRFSTDHCVKGELEYKKKERKIVPDYLKAVPDIEERYIMDNWVIYALAYKLSRHVAMVTEQRVFTEYKKLTPMFRTKIGIEIDYETIRSSTAQRMLELFISTVHKYTVVAKDDDPGDILLGFLRKEEKSTIVQGIKQMTENLEFVSKVDKHLDLLKGKSDTSIAQLLEDIMGLYYRSKVPKFEQPTRGRREHVVELNDKARKRLFKDVKLAKGCGYRYNKLCIYVEETNDNELMHSTQNIKALLFKYNITDFVVCQLPPLKPLHEVGAGIHIRGRTGTLGGFAYMGPQNKLCALLSRHVANGAKKLYLAENGPQIGKMVNTVKEMARNLDIAAAEILPDMEQNCKIKFKDSTRNPLPSKLCPIETKEWLKRLPIHFYGASSKFSEGKITEFYLDETEHSHIIIEGNTGEGEFCIEGDSGAVICADDPEGENVHVISMLIGKFGLEEEKKQYLTFRMAHGLHYLSEVTGQQFQLCS